MEGSPQIRYSPCLASGDSELGDAEAPPSIVPSTVPSPGANAAVTAVIANSSAGDASDMSDASDALLLPRDHSFIYERYVCFGIGGAGNIRRCDLIFFHARC